MELLSNQPTIFPTKRSVRSNANNAMSTTHGVDAQNQVYFYFLDDASTIFLQNKRERERAGVGPDCTLKRCSQLALSLRFSRSVETRGGG